MGSTVAVDVAVEVGSGVVGPAVAVDVGQPSGGDNVLGMVEVGRRVPVNCDHDEVAAGRGVAEGHLLLRWRRRRGRPLLGVVLFLRGSLRGRRIQKD